MGKSYVTSVDRKHNSLWIMLPDSIDMDNYKTIETAIFNKITSTPVQKIVCDLSQTTALFSAGVGVIMRMHTLVNDNAKQFYLVNVADRVREGLETMGLDRVLSIFPSFEAFQRSLDETTA